jgi:hypothetical protein
MKSSLLQALSNIGEPNPHVRVASDFSSVPGKNLKEMEATMRITPHPHQWVQTSESFHDEDWCEETQGVTFGGGFFYFACNTSDKPNRIHDQVIYRYLGQGDDEVEPVLEFNGEYGSHLGAVDFFGGKLFCAMEGPVGVLVVEVASGNAARSPLGALRAMDGSIKHDTQGVEVYQATMSWCAVNPWNNLLYSSENGDDTPTTIVHAYNPEKNFAHEPLADIRLSHAGRHIQGGCFSANGHLLLATDERDPNDSNFKLIRTYSVFNGFYFGAARVLVLAEGNDQELEDVCYAPMIINGVDVQVHALLLENVGPTVTPAGVVDPMDNVFFKHFSTPPAP